MIFWSLTINTVNKVWSNNLYSNLKVREKKYHLSDHILFCQLFCLFESDIKVNMKYFIAYIYLRLYLLITLYMTIHLTVGQIKCFDNLLAKGPAISIWLTWFIVAYGNNYIKYIPINKLIGYPPQLRGYIDNISVVFIYFLVFFFLRWISMTPAGTYRCFNVDIV